MENHSLDHVMAMLERDSANENIVIEDVAPMRQVAVGESITGSAMAALPRPLADLLPDDVMSLDDIPWKSLAPGVKHFQLKSIESKGTVRLMKIAPGVSIPGSWPSRPRDDAFDQRILYRRDWPVPRR